MLCRKYLKNITLLCYLTQDSPNGHGENIWLGYDEEEEHKAANESAAMVGN